MNLKIPSSACITTMHLVKFSIASEWIPVSYLQGPFCNNSFFKSQEKLFLLHMRLVVSWWNLKQPDFTLSLSPLCLLAKGGEICAQKHLINEYIHECAPTFLFLCDFEQPNYRSFIICFPTKEKSFVTSLCNVAVLIVLLHLMALSQPSRRPVERVDGEHRSGCGAEQ